MKVNGTTAEKILSRRAKDGIFIALMLLIPVVHFIIFWGVVNFNSLLMAFQRLDPRTGGNIFTWDNFKDLLVDLKYGDTKVAIQNTFLTFGLMLLLLPWGFFLTYFLYKKIPLSGFWRTMLFVPTILPAVAMTAIFTYLLYPLAPVGSIWRLFGAQTPNFITGEKYSRWTVLAYIFWTNFGGQFIIFSGAMSRISKEITESARLDGAGMRVEMLRIILPLCWPTFSMLLLLNIAGLFMASGPVLLLTGGRFDSTTIAFTVFNDTNNGFYNRAAALGTICTVILFPIVIVSRYLLGKVYAGVEF